MLILELSENPPKRLTRDRELTGEPYDSGEEGKALGGIYCFGFLLFMLEVPLSIYTMRLVYATFRGSGHTIADARNAAAREGVSASMRV